VLDELSSLDATAQADLVRRGEITPRELVDGAITRIERLNPLLNAVIIPLLDQARARAVGKVAADRVLGVTDKREGATSDVPGYVYDPGRDQRWRAIVDRYCVLTTKNEADVVVPRLLQAGVQRILEVGSHWGPVAERLAPRGVTTICIELDAEIVRLAHKPAVQATAARLPFADESVDAVTALNVLYFLPRPEEAVAEARRVLRWGGIFVACTQCRDNDPELRAVAPGWGEPSSFDGDNAEAIVRTVFADVQVEPWDLVAYRFPDRASIAEYLAVFYRLPEDEARRRADFLPSPLALTKRGVFVWATRRD
jgi:SAM-dependent methyltransferase